MERLSAFVREVAALPARLLAALWRWRLLLLFTVMPPLEMFLLLQLGSLLGPSQTLLLLIATGVLGAIMAKREGLHLLRQLSEELRRGLPPGVRLVEGGLVVVGGVLLITPGVLTDIAGILFILPITRRYLAPRVLKWLMARFQIAEIGEHPGDPTFESDGVRIRRDRAEASPLPQAPHPFASPFDDLP